MRVPAVRLVLIGRADPSPDVEVKVIGLFAACKSGRARAAPNGAVILPIHGKTDGPTLVCRLLLAAGSRMSELDSEFASLINRASRDDNQALAALIALYESEIRHAAQILLGKALRSSFDPTDLVQSVHLQLITGIKRKRFVITNPEQLRSLALTLLRNNFISHLRHHRIRTRHHTRLATAGGTRDGPAAAAFAHLTLRGRPNLTILWSIWADIYDSRINDWS